MSVVLGFHLLLGVVGSSSAVAAPPSAEAAEAQRLHTLGSKLYNLSMWKAALDEFQKAYLVRADPALLFNIGQCHRQLGDAQNAANSYRAFLRESRNLTASQREQVQALLDQMELAIKETRANQPPIGTVAPTAPKPTAPPVAPPAPEPAPVTTPAPLVTPTVDAPPADPTPTAVVATPKPVYKRWYLWVGVGAVVVVGLGVGLGVGLTASRVTYPSVENPAATVRF